MMRSSLSAPIGSSFTVTCFTCRMPSSKEWAQRVWARPTTPPRPFYPFLLGLAGKGGEWLADDASTFLCAFCHASLEAQWNAFERSGTGLRERSYNLNSFICAVCSVETYRKRVRALPFQEFPFLAKERPKGSITLGNNPLAVVCLDCSETLWAQSAEYERWGLPVQKRQFNWMTRPPPPENSMEATVARLPSGETQLPRCPPIEPLVIPRRKESRPLSQYNLAKTPIPLGGGHSQSQTAPESPLPKITSSKNENTSRKSSSSSLPEGINNPPPPAPVPVVTVAPMSCHHNTLAINTKCFNTKNTENHFTSIPAGGSYAVPHARDAHYLSSPYEHSPYWAEPYSQYPNVDGNKWNDHQNGPSHTEYLRYRAYCTALSTQQQQAQEEASSLEAYYSQPQPHPLLHSSLSPSTHQVINSPTSEENSSLRSSELSTEAEKTVRSVQARAAKRASFSCSRERKFPENKPRKFSMAKVSSSQSSELSNDLNLVSKKPEEKKMPRHPNPKKGITKNNAPLMLLATGMEERNEKSSKNEILENKTVEEKKIAGRRVGVIHPPNFPMSLKTNLSPINSTPIVRSKKVSSNFMIANLCNMSPKSEGENEKNDEKLMPRNELLVRSGTKRSLPREFSKDFIRAKVARRHSAPQSGFWQKVELKSGQTRSRSLTLSPPGSLTHHDFLPTIEKLTISRNKKIEENKVEMIIKEAEKIKIDPELSKENNKNDAKVESTNLSLVANEALKKPILGNIEKRNKAKETIKSSGRLEISDQKDLDAEVKKFEIEKFPSKDSRICKIIQDAKINWKKTKEDIELILKSIPTTEINVEKNEIGDNKTEQDVTADLKRLRKTLSLQQLELKALVRKIRERTNVNQ